MDSKNNLIYAVIGCLLVVGRVSAYFNQTYDIFSFVLADVSLNNSQGKNAFTYAQQWCRSNRNTLVTIYDKDVQSYINQFISSATRNDLMNTFDYVLLNGKLYSNLPGTWMWANGQVKNAGVTIQDEKVLTLRYYHAYLSTTDYKLHASRHDVGRYFICEYPGSTSDCADGMTLNGRCYKRFLTSLTWYSARNKCAEGEGDLASFETLSDSTFNSTLRSTLFANSSANEFWVGMERVDWSWEDTGLSMKYSSWESGSPSNSFECLCLRLLPGMSDWLWLNVDCSGSFRFICMTYATRTPTGAQSTVSGYYLSTPPSLSSSDQMVLEGLAFGPGVGVGVIIGLVVMGVVLVIIFLKQYLTKRRQNCARGEEGAVQESTLQHIPTSDKAHSSAAQRRQFGETKESTEENYEALNN